MIGLLNLNIHFLLNILFSIKLHPEGMLGLSDSNKRKSHGDHRIAFTCKGVAGPCCKDISRRTRSIPPREVLTSRSLV